MMSDTNINLNETLEKQLGDGLYNKQLEPLRGHFSDNLSLGDTIYLIENGRSFRIHHYQGQINIVEVTNANRRGKVCKKVVFMVDRVSKGNAALELFFSNKELFHKSKFSEVFEFFHQEGQVKNQSIDDINIYASEMKGVDVLDIFGKYPVVKKRPTKFSKNILLNLLMNNQVRSFRKGRYTDDYAYDAETNYGRGVYENFKVAEDIHGYGSDSWNASWDDEDYKGDKVEGNPNVIQLTTIHAMNYYTLTLVDDKLMVAYEPEQDIMGGGR